MDPDACGREPAGLDQDVVVLVEAVDGEHRPAGLARESVQVDAVRYDGREAVGAFVHRLAHLALGSLGLVSSGGIVHGTSVWSVETRD
ncbi:hypothetical protein COV05_03205 [Candidatus Uhrbacteria bacterium CG10_big_fil_rev_8_21_14_0_10_48_16]|uniref:Uncharacterized protein n=1 Tax=Candidatus Uhrbacteria bacterium CG10_big_fil_rev_8_21_14_0_10_48_16 TaxID=1975038 RepID=A0A2M8LGV1_9BACT|nr:MAG: hypothetical protein COV05_03205 [Candidatus Uhrbacteria bacterium CG10_big_fil_rev_8_21_14_0_10_48_16]